MRSLIRLAKIFVLICALFVLTTTGTSEIHAANIHLTWEDTSDNAVGFKIERVVAGVANGTFTVGANSTSYVDSGLSPGIVYCYLVRAYNSAGDSDPSNEVCAAAEETTTVSPTTKITPVASLVVSPTTVAAGRTIGTVWSGIAVPSPTDWIGLYVPGADETSFIDYIYVSCSRIADSTARASGSCSYPLPANLNGGNYELRLFANRGFTRLATSNSFTAPVTPGVPVGPPGGPSGLTIQILQ